MNREISCRVRPCCWEQLLFLGFRIPSSAQRQTPAPLVVRCGTLIHPHSHQVQKNIAIQIANGKIIWVAPVSEVDAAQGTRS